MTLDAILKKDFEFLEVNRRLYDSTNNKDLLDIRLWVKPTDVCHIESYRLRLDYQTSLKILTELIQRRVPSNYKIFELKDEVILARLHNQKESDIEKKLISSYEPITEIEYNLQYDSLHNTLWKLLDADAKIVGPDAQAHPLGNLVFNRNNLNLSCRILSKETGFTTKQIFSTMGSNFTVRSEKELTNVPNIISSHYCEDLKMYESIIGLEDCELVPYETSINGRIINPLYLLSTMSGEFYMRRFSHVFELQVMKNVLDAYASKVFEPMESIPKSDYRNYNGSSNLRQVVIAPVFTIPSITDLSERLKSSKFEDVVLWLRQIAELYGADVFNLAKFTMSTIDFESQSNLALQVVLQQQKLREQFARAGILSHAVKTSCAMNRVFMEIYKQKRDIQTSCIFDMMLKMETFPSANGGSFI